MKVLDLQCADGHGFEGWFASEDDFQQQLSSGLLTCPVCGNAAVAKKPSAPRLNIGTPKAPTDASTDTKNAIAAQPVSGDRHLLAAWHALAERLLSGSEDVGKRFAEEARRIHHGEVPERAISGQATVAEAQALLEEGIPVLPLPYGKSIKSTLH